MFFYQGIVENLARKGHNMTERAKVRGAVYAISVEPDGFIYANADERKGGGEAGIDSVADYQ